MAIDRTIEGQDRRREASNGGLRHHERTSLCERRGTIGFNSEGTVAVRGGRVTDTDVSRVLRPPGR